MFTRLRASLSRTRQSLTGGLSSLFGAGKKIDQQTLDELEELLILADVGVETSMRIMDSLGDIIRRDRITEADALYPALEEVLLEILQPSEVPLSIPSGTQPFVILIVGVNGAGKTTSIGKITAQLVQQGKSVLLAAGDTFRAAASEQLKVWGERNQVHVHLHSNRAQMPLQWCMMRWNQPSPARTMSLSSTPPADSILPAT